MSVDYKVTSIDKLITIMLGILSGNNQLIESSSVFLKIYIKHIQSSRKLLEVLLNSENQKIKLLTTVLLKRSIARHFRNMSSREQEQFKKKILTQFNQETNFLIQKNIAGIIGKLVPIVNILKWKDLQIMFEQRFQFGSNSKSALILLNQLIGQYKLPQNVINFMLKCLNDQKLAIDSLECIETYVSTENVICDDIPIRIMQVWKRQQWNQHKIAIAMNVFSNLALKKNQMNPLIIRQVIQKTVRSTSGSKNIKINGLFFLKQLSQNQYKTKILNTNQQLLKYSIQLLCNVVCLPSQLPQIQSMDSVEYLALSNLETFAQNIKQNKFYPIIFDILLSFLNSNDVQKIKGGFLILISVCKNCAERLKRNLSNPLMNKLIPKGLQHAEQEVRNAAVKALVSFSKYLIPEILKYHEIIVSSLIRFMKQSIDKVQQDILVALEVLFDNMEQVQILTYLPQIIPILQKLWNGSDATLQMKKATLETISSLINAVQNKFEPYIEISYNIAVDSIYLQDITQENYLRSEGITILGRLAFYFTKNQYEKSEQFLTHKICRLYEPLYDILVNSDNPKQREGCFTFFYLLASSINHKFSLIFEKIIVEVIKGCQHELMKPAEPKDQSSQDDQISQGSSNYSFVNVNIPEMNEKAAAIYALGSIANACPIQFIPYFQKAYKILQKHYRHFNDNVRLQCSNAYQNITLALIKSKYEGKIPQYKVGLPCIERYDKGLQDYFSQQLLPILISSMAQQSSADVSASTIQTLENLIKIVGPVLIDKKIDKIIEGIVSLFQGQDNFINEEQKQQQQSSSSQEDKQPNQTVFSPLCELIATLGKVLKSGFISYLKKIFSLLTKCLSENKQNINQTIQALQTISSLFRQIPQIIAQNQNTILIQINKLKAKQDDELNKNICYCLGVMYEGSPQTMAPFLNNGIHQLKNFYQKSTHLGTKQNALAAMARLIVNSNSQIQINIVLSYMIDSMPFQADEAQEKEIWKLIIHLSKTKKDLILPYSSIISDILSNDMKEPKKYNIEKEVINQQFNHLREVLNSFRK